ncbi:MFS transporter [Gordonia bronchialis]|uniref:MFS transporter n=1 Tax=Gordonia bronchialis TaxID=2054 RepID=UPI00226F8BBC|nr:MFS transporter [Gordonia bronchialis]
MTDSIATPSPAVARKRLAYLVLGLCWFAILCDGMDTFVYGAVLPHMLDDESFGLDAASAGDVGSLATLGMLIGALAAGPIADRVGRRWTLIGGVALFSIASLICSLAPTVELFAGARLIAGLGLGGLIPTAISLVIEYAPAHRANLFVALLMTAHQAGGILATALGLAFLGNYGWRFLFLLGALPLIIAVAPMIKYLPESLSFLTARGRTDEAAALAARHGVNLDDIAHELPPRRAVNSVWHSLRELFEGRRGITTILFWIASFAGLLLVYGFGTWLPVMMRANGYALGSALAFLLVVNLGGIFGFPIAGRIADRIGATKVAVIWFALTCVGILVMSLQMPVAATYAVVFLTGAALFSAQTMVYASVAAHSQTDFRATAIGWTSGIGRFGAVFGPWLGGILIASGAPKWGFFAYAIAAGVAIVAMLLITQVDRSRWSSAVPPTGAVPEVAAAH